MILNEGDSKHLVCIEFHFEHVLKIIPIERSGSPRVVERMQEIRTMQENLTRRHFELDRNRVNRKKWVMVTTMLGSKIDTLLQNQGVYQNWLQYGIYCIVNHVLRLPGVLVMFCSAFWVANHLCG